MMRLDKLLAHSGFGTRKEVKKLIRSGLVVINDEVVKKDDLKVDEYNDEIIVDGFLVDYMDKLYLMMNKPEGYICANDDSYHETIFDLMIEYAHLDLVCVGRLDKDTTGLLLITNDGKFVHEVTSPKKKLEKRYQAYVNGKISAQDIAYFNEGVIIEEGIQCKPAKLRSLTEEETNSWVEVIISEGRFHQVKRMLKAIDLEVLKLNRDKIGNLELDSSLELGEYRLLSEAELTQIF